MNTAFFIGNRISKNKLTKHNYSNAIIKITIISISLCMCIMILSISILSGFKKQIWEKLSGFNGHIIISNLDNNESFQTNPISKQKKLYNKIKNTKGIKNINEFAYKPGIIKKDENMQGIIIKGVGCDYSWDFLDKHIIEGKHFENTENKIDREVIISKYIANMLHLKVGDNMQMFFIQDPPRHRKYTISGIYDTNLEEYDKIFMFADIDDVIKLNDWEKNQISGYEIFTKNFKELNKSTKLIQDIVGYKFLEDKTMLNVENVIDKNTQMQSWLNLTNLNVVVILSILFFIAIINMISGILIIILEKTNLIGILKAIGAKNFLIQKIFVYNAINIIGKGLLWGNIIGISICIIQKFTHIIPLNPDLYYVNSVPIDINVLQLISLNITTFTLILSFMLISTIIINKFDPVKIIRFR